MQFLHTVQLTLDLVLILFTTDTWIMIKKTGAKESFNYQTTLSYSTYKWEKSKR